MTDSLTADQEWERFSSDLALCLADLEEDEFLIISAKRVNYYVQFAAQGNFGMRAEATSNNFLKSEGEELSSEQYAALWQLGWRPPSYSSPDPDGSPNFFMDFSRPVDFGLVAELAVHTLRQVFHICHPGQLQYKSFSSSHTQIRFPTLRLKREV